MPQTTFLLTLALALASLARGQDSPYLLGPDDQINVHLNDLKEIEFSPVRIDAAGNIRLNYAGTVHAAGLTTAQLATEITRRLSEVVNDPRVTVEVSEFASQPVSVVGSVNKPGVYQLRGRRNLLEVLSMAEGLRTDAGYSIKITRERQFGAIPLANSTADPGGKFYTAEVNVSTILAARDPNANIPIRPHDVISVPRAELVYVVGSVKKPGGFVLGDKENVSVLQAISMAEGLDHTASPQGTKILRAKADSSQRFEIPVNVRDILASKAQDQQLQANDILFVPNSASKSAAIRSLEAGIQMATGIVIWRR